MNSLTQRLENNGWTVECESPFELRNEDGSFASGQAATMVCWCIMDDWYEDSIDEEAEYKYNREAEANFERDIKIRRPENDCDYEK